MFSCSGSSCLIRFLFCQKLCSTCPTLFTIVPGHSLEAQSDWLIHFLTACIFEMCYPVKCLSNLVGNLKLMTTVHLCPYLVYSAMNFRTIRFDIFLQCLWSMHLQFSHQLFGHFGIWLLHVSFDQSDIKALIVRALSQLTDCSLTFTALWLTPLAALVIVI